jgi:hypothetical protein
MIKEVQLLHDETNFGIAGVAGARVQVSCTANGFDGCRYHAVGGVDCSAVGDDQLIDTMFLSEGAETFLVAQHILTNPVPFLFDMLWTYFAGIRLT